MALVNGPQPQQPGYTCDNCSRAIGAIEPSYQWGDAVVCSQCCALLQNAQPHRERRWGAHPMAIAGLALMGVSVPVLCFSGVGVIFLVVGFILLIVGMFL